MELGYKDEGIDLIAKKNNTLLLIQCKHWKRPDSITPTMIKEFYGNCHFFIDKHQLKKENITCLYVICDKNSLSYGAKSIFKTYHNSCEVLVIQ